VTVPEGIPELESVRGVWSRALERGINNDDDFFDLGGASVLALRIVKELREQGVPAEVLDVFDYPRFAEFAAHVLALPRTSVMARPGGPTTTDPPGEAAARFRDGTTPGPADGHAVRTVRASLMQEQMLLVKDDPEQAAPLVINAAFRLRGSLDKSALHLALLDVQQRHALLRSTFTVSPDGRAHMHVGAAAPLRLEVLERQRSDAEEEMTDDSEGLAVTEVTRRPFDRTAGPLVRCTAVVLGPEEHVLVLVFDHLIADATSIKVLLGELSVAYAARAAGRDPAWTALTRDFPEWAAEQRTELSEHGAYQVAEDPILAYWAAALGPDPKVLSAPLPGMVDVDAKSPAADVVLEVSSTATARLKERAASTGATPFTLLLAGLAATYQRQTGRDRVCVSTSVANRGSTDDRLVGPLAHDVYLPISLAEATRFEDVLDIIRRTVSGALRYSAVPAPILWDELWPGSADLPLVLPGLYLGLYEAPAKDFGLTGVQVEPAPITSTSAMRGLDISVVERRGHLIFSLTYLKGSHSVLALEELVRSTVAIALGSDVVVTGGRVDIPGDAPALSATRR